jgi:hypothetical protein
MGVMFCETTYAQVSFKINIVRQPIWGPVGYDHVDYYYLPDIQAYYYVTNHRYVYNENGRWISRSHLPPRYKDYDMYNARKVVINEPKPYMHHQENMAKYGSSGEHSSQPSIRDSHETKYLENKNHPEHSKWKDSKRKQGGDDDGSKGNKHN